MYALHFNGHEQMFSHSGLCHSVVFEVTLCCLNIILVASFRYEKLFTALGIVSNAVKCQSIFEKVNMRRKSLYLYILLIAFIPRRL